MAWEAEELAHEPFVLGDAMREVVERTVQEVSTHRAWRIHALNVRTNHVHVVITAGGPPEPVMNTLKSWATRRLREASLIGPNIKVWSRHGSTIYLFREANFHEKCAYVRDGQ